MITLLGKVSTFGVILFIVFRVAESKPPFDKKSGLDSDDGAKTNIVATKLTILNGKKAKFSYGVRTDPNKPIEMHKVLIPLSQAITSSSSSSSSSESDSGGISESGSSSESRSLETAPEIKNKVVPKKQEKLAAAVRKFAAGIKQLDLPSKRKRSYEYSERK